MIKPRILATIIAISALCMTSTYPVIADEPVVSTEVQVIEVNRDEVKLGDVIAMGNLVEQSVSCDLGAIQVTTNVPIDSKPKWLGIRINKDCRVVVNAMWEGQFDVGPTDVVDPLRQLLAKQSADVPETPSSRSSAPDELFNAPLSSGSKPATCLDVWISRIVGSIDP